MKALLNFGMVTESTDIHEYVERLLKAQHQVQTLLSLEQQVALEKANAQQISIQEMFPEYFGK